MVRGFLQAQQQQQQWELAAAAWQQKLEWMGSLWGSSLAHW
jgi:hypothetical protein